MHVCMYVYVYRHIYTYCTYTCIYIHIFIYNVYIKPISFIVLRVSLYYSMHYQYRYIQRKTFYTMDLLK